MKNIVITGDSLSYNRYSYDDNSRINASDCHIGMDSWSFKLRKKIISSTAGFLYGDELEIREKITPGMGEDIDDINALFGKRVVTVKPENGLVHIKIKAKTEKLVIYFQRRYDNYCRFNISADGVFKKSVDTFGSFGDFQGYGLMPIELDCDKQKNEHTIVLEDFEFTEKAPLVTIAGVSIEMKCVYTTGQGGRTAKFIDYHFEERIGKYSPDLLVMIFGGNDAIYYNAKEYRLHLTKIFERVSLRFPFCKIITITIPPTAKCLDEMNGIKIESDKDLNILLEKYNMILKELSDEYSAVCVDLKKLFRDIPTKMWRYDNVHLSNFGNELLYNEICKIIFNNTVL